MSSMDKFKFIDSVNRAKYYDDVFQFLINEESVSDDNLCYLLAQVGLSIPKDEITFNFCKLISTIYTIIFSKLLSNGYVKFQVKLVELADRFRNSLDTTKLNSKNVFTVEKKLAVICLSSIFAKFGGFLNSFKTSLLTACYKHLKKLMDNSSKELDSNYFDQFLILIATLLDSNPNLDAKIFQRLLKLHKIIGAKGKSYSLEKETYFYPVLSVIHVNNILTTLLRTPFYITSITTKKSHHNALFYLNTISPYLSYLIASTNTRYKNLRLSATKNITTLLTYSYINYGVDENESKVFNFSFNYLWDHYLKSGSNLKVKTAVIEILMQFISSLNLIFQTGVLPNSKNFISFKSFEILNLTISKVFSNELATEGVLHVGNSTNFNTATVTLNFLNVFYQHMLNEVKSDVNKLIILQHLFDEYFASKVTDNSYRTISLLQLSQLIISDLGQYILTHDSHKMEETLMSLALDSNPYVRILSIQTLTKLNVDIDKIISGSFSKLNGLVGAHVKQNDQQKDTFIESHSDSLLVSTILSSADSISTDLILSILSLSNSILKKFNSNVLINNLINGNDFSTLSNTNYEKQISSWILMMGLFNYHQRQKNPFLLGNNPLLNIWKSLLAHNVPSNFIKIEKGTIVNFNELMKFIEIKNYSLSCLICFIDYAISLNSMPPDFAKQLTPLLTKCYSFISNVETQLPSSISPALFKAIQIQKLRILTNFVKIVPHIIKLTDEVNISTDMLLSVVKNFNDYNLFNYKLLAPEITKNKVIETSDYDIYQVDDGLAFGLTSKINMFQLDELLFKNEGQTHDSNNEVDVDLVPNSSGFIIESRDRKSNLSPLSNFDGLEGSIYQPIQSSIMNDYLFTLISNSKSYSNSRIEVVPVESATVDLSIELFQLVFPYLSLKIQQSILEHIRSSMFHAPDVIKPVSSSTGADKPMAQSEAFNFERQKAVLINSSVAIHGMLNHLIMKNVSHLKLNRMIVTLILETLKGINTSDLFLINLNAESVGLCLSVLDDSNKRITNETTNHFINLIVEKDDPYSRVSSALCLGNIFKYNSRSTNVSSIIDVLLKLVLDPHPTVHHWCLESLIMIVESYHNYAGSDLLVTELISTMENIYTSDDFGLQSKSVISSNLNLSFEGGDKNVLLTRMVRVIVKMLGPGICSLTLRSSLQSLILKITCLTVTNFDLVSRELIVLIDELNIFDKGFIGETIRQKFLSFLYTSNIKTGVYNENLILLPFVDVIMKSEESDKEIFPVTSSDGLLDLAINSLHQVVKVSTSASSLYKTFDKELQDVVWILLESNNEQVYEIFKLWIDLDISKGARNEDKANWVENLISKFAFSEKELYRPLNNLFKKKFNSASSLFSARAKTVNPIKQGGAESRSFASARTGAEIEGDEGEDSDASEEANVINTGAIAEESTPVDSNLEKDAPENGEMKGAKVQKISDEEPVRWQFKLKMVLLLNQLMSYAKKDSFLFKYISTRLSELVRISFIACTSQILKLRFAGLELLGHILEDYAHLKDPLYENLSILDQQQAQIISAILPAFGADSSIDLICEGFEIASVLIGSHITSIPRLQRLVKIMVTSLHDLTLLKANNKSDSSLKVGEVLIKSTREQNRVTLAVLNSWAKLKSQTDGSDDDLAGLLNEHLKVLTSLWVYSLKQYSMLKFGKEYTEGDSLSIDIYDSYWRQIVMAVSIVIRDDTELIEGILGSELNNFFFAIFAQCVEILFRTNSSNVEILKILKNILSLKSSSSIIYHDLVFAEVVDLFDRLSVNSNNDQKLILIDIITELYLSYFENEVGVVKSEEDMHRDVDKLFELLRLNVSYVNNVLPFIRDKEIQPEKLRAISDSDIVILKKSFSSLLLMINKLPSIIQIDLYSCLLFAISLVYRFDNNEVISVVLPNLKKILNELSFTDQHELVSGFYQSIEPFIAKNQSQNSLITYMIFATTTTKSIILKSEDYDHISELLITSLLSAESAAIAMRSIKTLMVHTDNDNAAHIAKRLIPKLVELVTYGRVEEPRIVLELLIIFVKNLSSEKFVPSLMLIVPLLLWFSETDMSYVNLKLIDLIQFNPDGFKKFVAEYVTEEEKKTIEALVKANQNNSSTKDHLEQQHISLKMFGSE